LRLDPKLWLGKAFRVREMISGRIARIHPAQRDGGQNDHHKRTGYRDGRGRYRTPRPRSKCTSVAPHRVPGDPFLKTTCGGTQVQF
jgi:hypothetical protein